MTDDDPHAQILRFEDEIDQLTEIVKRCRKAILISKLAVAAGVTCLLLLMLGVIRFDPMIMIGAIAVVIGGTVILGSNTSTSKQTEAAIKATEGLRAELIGKINLRVVKEAADRPDRTHQSK